MPSLLNDSERQQLQPITQGVTQQRMLREMAEALDELAREIPFVLLLEDLHWSDISTLELISVAARRTEPARLMVIGTYRPVEVLSNDHRLRAIKEDLELHRQCEELRLSLLNEQDVAAYLRIRFANSKQGLSDQVAQLLHQRTEGNPLFMVNVVDYLVEQGSPFGVDKIETPRTIHQMIERNLERLDTNEQRILEAASVAGAEFSAAAVAAAVEREVGDVESCCTQLARHEQFVSTQGPITWPDGTVAASFRFHHALYQEVLYERLPAGRRVELHLRIAEREELAYGKRASEIAAELAHHYTQAGLNERAIGYWQLAGQRAIEHSAFVEAINHFTIGLQLLQTTPNSPERIKRELSLQMDLGASLKQIKGFSAPEVGKACARALELCRQLGQTPQLFSALEALAWFHA